MSRWFAGLPLCLVLVTVHASAVAAQTSLVVNGSFELGPPPFDLQDIDIPPGSTSIVAWVVTGAGVDLLEDPWDVFDGVRAIDLDGRSPGGIQQSFATTKGQVYRVTFDVSGNPGGEPKLKRFRVTVDGAQHDYRFNSTNQAIDALKWRRINFKFMADGTSATLSFESLSEPGDAYGALLDNVSVVKVGQQQGDD